MDKANIINNILIVNLADDIKYLEEASMYMWKEWAEQYGTKYEDIIYRTNHCLNKDSIPQTYIAKYNDELVGFVSVWNNDLPFRQDLFPWLAGLYVKEEYRGIGIGILLQKKCIEVAKKLGYTKLYLITEHENYYERTGWKFIEKAPLRGGIYTRLYEFEIKNGVIKMYRKIKPNNKIFESAEYQKDKYKFNIVSKILAGEEVLLYSDEQNYFLARNKVGMPTWIWTKDGLEDKQILEEIKEAMKLFLTDLDCDQFTCKKEFYSFLIESGYEKINKGDYFELGFLTCNNLKNVKQTDGNMVICTKKDNEKLLSLFVQFTEFMNKTTNNNSKATIEELKEEMDGQVERNCLYCWKNKENKIVCIANYQVLGDTARIGHVFTLEEERGKGYAANLVHDLTERLLNEGLQPLLYTDYNYPASNKAYINAGYEDKGILVNFSCSREKKKSDTEIVL